MYHYFSNSLRIHQVGILTVTVFGYLILLSIDFLRFYFSVFSLVLVSVEKIYQTLKTAFDHISKDFEVRQKYSATRRTSNSLIGVWKCGQTRSFVFDMLLAHNHLSEPHCITIHEAIKVILQKETTKLWCKLELDSAFPKTLSKTSFKSPPLTVQSCNKFQHIRL